jgi:lipopolysaccharide export system protein LptA
MKPSTKAALMTFVMALAGLSVSARAQLSPSGGNGPIDITADEAEVVNSKCMTIWRGAAEALQGDTRLRANVITAYLKPGGVGANGQPSCGATDRVEAEGDVYYVNPTQTARGDAAVYTAANDQIVMTGNVIVVQGHDVATGDKLTIQVATHQAVMESAGHVRVRGVFYPNQPGGATLPGLGH